jgi:hypothetical protein
VRRVHRRAIGWLGRNGYLGDPTAPSQEATGQTSLDVCAAIAMQRGAVRTLRDNPDTEEDGATGGNKPPRDGSAVEHEEFNLHASVAIAADDDLGRERLMRYGARPPLAQGRLRRLPGGRLAYRIKQLRNGRAKHRVMTPLEFLARLAALVPPPRYPLLRYSGVLGPRSSWRRDIVPRPLKDAKPCVKRTREQGPSPAKGGNEGPRDTTSARSTAASGTGAASQPALGPTAVAKIDPGGYQAAVLLTPNVLSVKHWDRMLAGLLYAGSPRADWASLLRRSFEVDVLQCARCGGRVRVLGEITEPMVSVILEALEMPTEAPPVGRARDPTELLGEAAEE